MELAEIDSSILQDYKHDFTHIEKVAGVNQRLLFSSGGEIRLIDSETRNATVIISDPESNITQFSQLKNSDFIIFDQVAMLIKLYKTENAASDILICKAEHCCQKSSSSCQQFSDLKITYVKANPRNDSEIFYTDGQALMKMVLDGHGVALSAVYHLTEQESLIGFAFNPDFSLLNIFFKDQQQTTWVSYNVMSQNSTYKVQIDSKHLPILISVFSLSHNAVLVTELYNTLEIVTAAGERFSVCLKAETIASGITLMSEKHLNQCRQLVVKKVTNDASHIYAIDENWNLLTISYKGEETESCCN